MPEYFDPDKAVTPSPAAASTEPAPDTAKQETPTPAEPSSPPRNPDGTFAPRQSQPQHSAHLLSLAASVGLTDREIAGLDTDAALARINDRHWLLAQMQQRQATSQGTAPPSAPEPEEELPDLSQYDETLANTIRKMWQRDLAREKEVRAIKESYTQTQRATTETRLDDAFAALPEKYHKLLGDGPMNRCTDEQKFLRNTVLGKCGVNPGALPSQRILDRQIQQGIEALTSLFGPPPSEAGEYKPQLPKGVPTKEDFANGPTLRPTQRNGAKEPQGKELATQNLDRRMREMGIHPSQSRKAELGFLPGGKAS